jgi:flavin reductase (DIM6/NTAB) family NADH-FMN oxidoreductase RutF
MKNIQTYNPHDFTKKAMYQLLTSTVVPRPIALVTTLNDDNVLNIAPFSYFNIVTTKPARLSIVVGHSRGKRKDTARNILSHQDFVIHIVTEDILYDANQTASALPHNKSELDLTKFTTSDANKVRGKIINQAKVYFECSLDKHLEFEDTDMIIGKIKHIGLNESIIDNNQVDPNKLKPIARLSGDDYAQISTPIHLKRPE